MRTPRCSHWWKMYAIGLSIAMLWLGLRAFIPAFRQGERVLIHTVWEAKVELMSLFLAAASALLHRSVHTAKKR